MLTQTRLFLRLSMSWQLNCMESLARVQFLNMILQQKIYPITMMLNRLSAL